MVGFIFGGDTKETPQSLARKRALVAQIMGSRNAPRNVGEGLVAIGDGIVANVMDRRANAGESAGMAGADDIRSQFMSAIMGSDAFPPAPNPGNSTSMATMEAPDMASARVAQAHGDSTMPAGNLSESKQAFISGLLPAAMEESKRTGIDPRIIVAQAAQETGWGRAAPGNNYFGIKSHGQGGGQTLNTHEYINGRRVNVADSFRTFDSPADSVRGYGDFILNNPRYRPLMAAQGMDAQLDALQASGYATDPNYSRSVGSIARSIPLPDATPQPSNGLTSEALQAWGQQNYAPAQGGAVDAVNALGNAQPVGVAETEADILAQERAMMGQDPQAFQQPGTGPRVAAPMQQPAPPMPPPQMVQDQPVAAVPQPQPGGLPEMAGRNPRPVQSGPSVQQIMQVLQNPFMDEGTKAYAAALLEQQMQQNDPMRQLDMGIKQEQLNQLRNPRVDPTDTQRNLMWRAQEAGLQPGTQEYADFMRTGGGKDGVTVNNIMGGEKFGEEFAKGDAQALSAVSEAGLSAQRNISRIDRLGEILAATPQGAMASWQQIAGQYGLNTEGLSNIQAAQALINSLVPEQRPPGSGPMSDADLELFKQSLPRIINQPGGNGIILNTMRAIAQYDAQGAEIVQALRRGEMDRATAFEALQSRENPLAMLNDIPRQQGGHEPPPSGVDPSDWEYMTPEERALFQ